MTMSDNDPEDLLARLEEDLVLAARRYLAAWQERTGSLLSDPERASERPGLDESLVHRLCEAVQEATLAGRLRPAIAGFKPYSSKDRRELEEDALDLANNENPLGASSRVVDVLCDKIRLLGHYPPLSDIRLRERLAAILCLSADHLVLGRGANHLISELAYTFLREGDRVALCDRSFPVYAEMASRSGCAIIPVGLGADHQYRVDLLDQSLEQRPRILFLGSPNNPTGVILEAPDFERLVAKLPEDTLLVIDECYRDFAEAGATLPDTLRAVAAGRNVISLRSFSKAHGLASLRMGYMLARPEIATYLERRREPYHTSQMTIYACLAALEDKDHVRASIELVRRERPRLAKGLRSLGLEVWPSHGNFLLFRALPGSVNPEDGETDGREAAAKITANLEKRFRIKIRDLGRSFNVPGHLRVSVGLAQENTRFLAALSEVLVELGLRSEAEPLPPPV